MNALSKPDAKRVLQETRGRVLLEIKSAIHRAADVDQQPKVQRQIRFPPEVQNRLRRLVVVKNIEIVLVQVAHELAMLVGRDEQHVHLIHPGMQGDDCDSADRQDCQSLRSPAL